MASQFGLAYAITEKQRAGFVVSGTGIGGRNELFVIGCC